MTEDHGTRRPELEPAPEGRIGSGRYVVNVDVADLAHLTLYELLELADLAGVDLDVLLSRLSAGRKSDVLRAVIALAVIQERERDPSLVLADARLWDIRVKNLPSLGDPPDPTNGQPADTARES